MARRMHSLWVERVGATLGMVTAPLPDAVNNLVGLVDLGFLGYMMWLNGSRGRSPGKALTGLKVVAVDTGELIGDPMGVIRYVVSVAISVLTCGLGGLLDELFPLWDERRQTLHDKVVRTAVLTGQVPVHRRPAASDAEGCAVPAADPLTADPAVTARRPPPLPAGATFSRGRFAGRGSALVVVPHRTSVRMRVGGEGRGRASAGRGRARSAQPRQGRGQRGTRSASSGRSQRRGNHGPRSGRRNGLADSGPPQTDTAPIVVAAAGALNRPAGGARVGRRQPPSTRTERSKSAGAHPEVDTRSGGPLRIALTEVVACHNHSGAASAPAMRSSIAPRGSAAGEEIVRRPPARGGSAAKMTDLAAPSGPGTRSARHLVGQVLEWRHAQVVGVGKARWWCRETGGESARGQRNLDAS